MQMQNPGTPPPWLGGSWLHSMPSYNELLRRQLQAEAQREHARLQRMQPEPAITFYYGPYSRPAFRIGSFPGVTGARPATGVSGQTMWERYPINQLLQHAGDLTHLPGVMVRSGRPPGNVEWDLNSGMPGNDNRAPPPSPAAGGFPLSPRATLRAWLFGTTLIVLIVVLVRAIDKCLDLNLLKPRRRRSQEWPTPTVCATNRQAADSNLATIPEGDFPNDHPTDYSEVISVDLPPPYSECLRDEQIPDPGGPKLEYEEPPPDYNDTFVQFSNKNGVPSVLIYSRRKTPVLSRRDISALAGPSSANTCDQQEVENNIERGEHTSNVTNDNLSEAGNNTSYNQAHGSVQTVTDAAHGESGVTESGPKPESKTVVA